MGISRISASGYSNTAPLVWSFLYGKNHGRVELILDNAPARSAEMLARDRVDAALVPVIAYQQIEGVRLVPDVCVGARRRVRSVCLVTKGEDLADIRSVSLDLSSKTSVTLTKIIFGEFLGFEPKWQDAEPNVDVMLEASDAALIIGDPALRLSTDPAFRCFDLAELWHQHTDLGFVFAMWMTKKESCDLDFSAARDEGVEHLDAIISNYGADIGLAADEMREYLSQNISYSIDESMHAGMELYFDLAAKNGLIRKNKPRLFVER